MGLRRDKGDERGDGRKELKGRGEEGWDGDEEMYSSGQKFRSPSCKSFVHLSLTQRLIHPEDTLPHRSDGSPIKTRTLHGINEFGLNWGESGKITLYSK